MKKKILYVITKSNWGGAQRYVYDLAAATAQRGYNVAVALGEPQNGEHNLEKKLHAAGVRIFRIASLSRDMNVIREFKALRALHDIIKKEQPDIVHLNSSKAGGLGSFMARIRGVPRIIFTVHGWYFLEERPHIVRMATKLLSWLTALCAHTVILVSKHDRQAAAWMPFVQKKFVIIHNGITPPDFLECAPARQFLRGKIDFDPHAEALWIGTISELHRNKGLDIALHALRDLRDRGFDFVFIVIGDGEERALLEALTERLDLRNRVFFVGHVEHAARLLPAFSIVTLTSRKEGLPYAIIEAGYAGRAVVASHVGGIPEMIDDMHSGILVKKGDTKQLADALTHLCKHTTAIRSFGEHLRERVTREFSFDAMFVKTRELYEEKRIRRSDTSVVRETRLTATSR